MDRGFAWFGSIMLPGNKMMKAFVFKRYGRSARPEFTELPHPTVGPDEILV